MGVTCLIDNRPPYYSPEMFSIIKDVHTNTPFNIAWVSVKQGYQLLMERGVTHNSDDHDSPPVLIPTKVEEKFPNVIFTDSYRETRVFGLNPDQKSFLFKMIQNLLPTREREIRISFLSSLL